VQYFIFFGQTGSAADLQLFPSPIFNMWGRVHSNGNIFIGSESTTINLRNYDDQGNLSPHLLSASGKIVTRRKNSAQSFNNTVFIKTSATGDTFTPFLPLPPVIDSTNQVEQEALFNEFVLVNQPEFTTPSRDLIRRGAFYEQRARRPEINTIDGIVITGRGDLGPGQIEVSVSRPVLTDVTNLIDLRQSSPGKNINGLPGKIIREQQNAFEDCREGDRQVNTTDIDINALERWYVEYLKDLGLDLAGDGILIYASRSPEGDFTNKDGNLEAIRLVANSPSSLPQLLDETTIVTDNPMYVQGDFNTIETRGVALISDAFNILSNDFKNHINCGPGFPPCEPDPLGPNRIPPNGGKACGISINTLFRFFSGSETTVNAAVFSGNVPGTTVGDGAHIYPRFHEYWYTTNSIPNFGRFGNRPPDLNILGSFINLWTSQQADGEFIPFTSDLYSAPRRNWGWDVRFGDPEFWPPFIPSVFTVERVGFLEE